MPIMATPSASTVPFTPRPTKKSGTSMQSLTNREIQKITGTIATTRRVRPDKILEELDYSGSGDFPLINRPVAESTRHAQQGRPSSPSSHDRPSSRSTRPDQTAQARVSSRDQPNGHAREHRHHTQPRTADGWDTSPPLLKNKVTISENRYLDGDVPEREVVMRVEVGAGGVAGEERLLDDVPLEVQEAWLCEDLLFVLQGIEGSLIRYDEGFDPLDETSRIQGARWRLDPSINPSLLSLVERLIPLGTCFTSVEAYMDLRNTPDFGMCGHALGSGIRSMLKEYRVLLAQLESLFRSSSTFTLQTLYFHLHPTLHTMSLLSALCIALETDDLRHASDESDDDDPLGEMAEKLGLGGDGLKGLLKAQEGFVGPGGPVLGGEVLGIICEREATMSGDPTAATLHAKLFQHASQPFSRMLIDWISTGYLSDPFDEFMVKESGHITKGVLESDYTDEYWERRYTLRDGSSLASSSKLSSGKAPASISSNVPNPRPGTTRLPGGACVPSFLQPWKHKILLAGKYLNVIRECGIEVKKPGDLADEDDGLVVMNDPKFYKRIDDAYFYANKTLLKLMLEEQELIPHLRSVKHFFFLDQSDFLTNFLDVAASELRKPAKAASLVKLQSLLDLSVRNPASSSSNDPYKDALTVTMQSQGLYDWLSKIVSRTGGLTDEGDLDFGVDGGDDDAVSRKSDKERALLASDALAFDYSVKFPLSLVISRKTITRYQIIFRFLLHLHHLESALGAMWLEHKSALWRSSSADEDMERWKNRIFSLRSRMLAFVRQVLAFATGEVIETNWRILEDKLAKVQTVDQLLRDHVDYLDTCLKQCMLTTSKLLGVYAKLMTTMSTFVSYQTSFNTALSKFIADPGVESDPAKVKHRWTVLEKFEINFDHHTKLHLDAVTYNAGSENVALMALVTRLHQTTLRR